MKWQFQMKLDIRISRGFQKHFKKDWLRRLVECSLGHGAQHSDTDYELGLFITNDETVRRLNREYRGVDKATDVLSFALTEGGGGDSSPSFIMPPDGIVHLGEVVVSYPRAQEQAEENGREVSEEVAWLVVHGVLHLLGYDHDEPARGRRMRALEKGVLSEVGKDSRE